MGNIISCFTLKSVRWWQTDNVMVKNNKKLTTVYKTWHTKARTEQHEPYQSTGGDDVRWRGRVSNFCSTYDTLITSPVEISFWVCIKYFLCTCQIRYLLWSIWMKDLQFKQLHDGLYITWLQLYPRPLYAME